jgi:CheY-like chemotaxis protein
MATIVVVNEEPARARGVMHWLRRAGHTPTVAVPGAAALQAAEAQPTGPPPASRGQLIYRLVTEGSDALVRQVCLRLEADRPPRWGEPTSAIPSWAALARLAQQEGLLSETEGSLLAAEPVGRGVAR